MVEYSTKKRRISEEDWKKVEQKIKSELSKRKADPFRKSHELIWKEVDRQVYMKSPKVKVRDPKQKTSWHSSIELGELAKASETITADVIRLMFPNARSWMEAHVQLAPRLDVGSGEVVTQKEQNIADGNLRALYTQQHTDFGLKERVRLSVKEALHHGSFCAEARMDAALLVNDQAGVRTISAPVWHPYSMWNTYPDQSPSVLGTNMFYTGSMILVDYISRSKLEDMAKGPGWMPKNLKRVPKRSNQVRQGETETEDVELVKHYGDCVIKREDGDISLPNSKVILANDVIVFYQANDLPYPPIIFGGYEKLDVRDPYHVSPIIKFSPMQKVATTCINKFIDGVALKNEPPLIYDGNDPTFVQNGGPTIAPGWKGAVRSMANYKVLSDVGDPATALEGYIVISNQIKSGTAADFAGGQVDKTNKTAQEVRAQSQRSEVRIVDFVDKLEFGLKSFLYMQHELNKLYMQPYQFYNPEMDSPDLMGASKEEIPPVVLFDVVGSKSILGEEERAQKMMIVTSAMSTDPGFAPLLNRVELAKQLFQDAGVKNPEYLLNIPSDEMQALEQQIAKQYEEAIQELERKVFELEKDLAITRSVNDAKVTEAQIKGQGQVEVSNYKAEKQAELEQFKAQVKATLESFKTGLQQMQQMSQPNVSVNATLPQLEGPIQKLTEMIQKIDESSKKRDDQITASIGRVDDTLKEVSKPKKKVVKIKRSPSGDVENLEVEG